ncbi:MAG: type II toxin-antitoxin system RelE/ParE family toxin [Desulfobulbaceae bacterium]|nr:type II toxin-antitoxin system RelE/ParE family toxin [Desulfobulbaceae bacterium]
MKIRWLDLANKDLDNIEAYISKDSPSAAIRVVLRIIEAVEILPKHPGAGRPGRVEGTKELVISNTPYIVPYRLKNGTVEVLRVFHHAKKWPNTF